MRAWGKLIVAIAIAVIVPGGSLFVLYRLLKSKGVLEFNSKTPFAKFSIITETNLKSTTKTVK